MRFENPPISNRFTRQPPSQRLIAAARRAGVTGGVAEIDAWARESGWLKQGSAKGV